MPEIVSIALSAAVIPSQDDGRDYWFTPPPVILPRDASLRPWSGGVKDQAQAGSCVGNSICNALELIYLQATGIEITLSRQFIYDLGRILEGRIDAVGDERSGMQPRTGLEVARKFGVPLESEYPYRGTEDIKDPRLLPDVMASAATRKLMRYERIDCGPETTWNTRSALSKAANAAGYPVIRAAIVGEKLRHVTGPLAQQDYGTVQFPGNPMIGRHATAQEGYDDAYLGAFDENSWGAAFGDNGFVRIGYDVFIDTFELWVIMGFAGCYIEPQRFTDQQISDYITVLVAQAGSLEAAAPKIWDGIKEYGLTFATVERAMKWPAGSIAEYAKSKGWT